MDASRLRMIRSGCQRAAATPDWQSVPTPRSSPPPFPARLAIGIGFFSGTWMVVNGLHHAITGDFVRWHGAVGAWAGLVRRAGYDPARFGPVFIGLGVLWLLAGNLFLYRPTRSHWRGMLALSLVSLGYLGAYTPLAVLQLLCLALPATRNALE